MAGISLKAQAADPTVEGVKKTDLFRVDSQLLVEEEGFNLRDYGSPEVEAYIEGFAASYAEGRYVPPLAVRTADDGTIIVVEGHCRRIGANRTAKRLKMPVLVDCIPFRGNDVDRVETMLRTGDSLKLEPLGVALGYARLRGMGHSNKDIAARMNKTGSHVEQMLLLADANHDVHDLVRSRKVPAYTAIEAVRAHGEKAGAFLLKKFEEAQELGKAKVSRGALKVWTPPRKVVVSVIQTVQTVVSGLDRATKRRLAEFEGMDEAQLKGQKIEVDAASFLGLVQAHGAVSEAQTKKEQSEAAQKLAQSQQTLGLEEGAKPKPAKAKG